MAENLIDLRRRIKSVNNTQKITRAMKTVSAAKLGRSVTELNRTRPVMEKVESLLREVEHKLAADIESHPFLIEKETGRTVIVAVSADKGLCGAFNSHLIENVEEHYDIRFKGKDEKADNPALVTIGNKAFKYFKKRDYPIIKNYPSVMSRLRYQHAMDLSKYLQDIYLNPYEPDPDKGIKEIEFVFTRYISSAKQEVSVRKLFPFETQWQEDEVEKGGEQEDIGYIFEPSAEEIFASLLPRYINTLVYQILLQSAASEHGARMIAMEMATQNASDMIRRLTLTRNKLRQASITKELLEIITATEALQK